jgi:Fic family protein
MKIPVKAPSYQDLFNKIAEKEPQVLGDIFLETTPVDHKGRYLHWDKLRHLEPKNKLTSEQWWLALKIARKSRYQTVSVYDKAKEQFKFSLLSSINKELHWLDKNIAGNIQSNKAITNKQTKNTYLIKSLVEEAINSSQLEGASTTRNVAKEMIRQNRPPKDKSEQMIFNNYHAMQFIDEIKNEKLTPSMVFELHSILTNKTLEENEIGRFRTESDHIYVVDRLSQEYLHTPPPANELSVRLQNLCDFANAKDENNDFLHPVIKAIILHFMIGYDHPFCDGNGRTARALFYWCMAKNGYWLASFITISKIIQEKPSAYTRAYLYTETDDSDLTYFIIHQLDVIHKAVNALHAFLDNKINSINKAKELLVRNPRLKNTLNSRQLALLKHALKHPGFSYIIKEHQQSHGVSYDIARKDLIIMADQLNLLVRTKQGRTYYFVAPRDLEQRIAD